MLIIEHLLKAIRGAAVYNPDAQVAPVCILWPEGSTCLTPFFIQESLSRQEQWEDVLFPSPEKSLMKRFEQDFND